MLPKPNLSRIAANAIRELRVDHGVEPDLDEIIWLHELGKRVENPVSGERWDLIGAPLRVGNVDLWRMTVMASIWFNDRARHWYRGSPTLLCYALAFALAHGRGQPVPDPAGRGWLERLVIRLFGLRDPRTLADLSDRTGALDAILYWVRSAGCSRRELDAALTELLGEAEEEDEDDQKKKTVERQVDWPGIVTDTAIFTGQTPADLVRTDRDAVQAAYLRGMRIEAARLGMRAPAVQSPTDQAHNELRAAVTAIIAAHRKPESTT